MQINLHNIMTKKAKFALLGGSLGLALVYDLLFTEAGLGVNFLLFTAIFIGLVVLYHLLFSKEKANYWAFLFLIPGLWYAASVAVYENPFVEAVAPLATILMLVLFLFWFGVIEIPLHKVKKLFPVAMIDFVWGWITHMGYPFKRLFSKKEADSAKTGRIVLAIFITIPLLMIFGALFMSADLLFREWVTNAFDFDMDELTVWRVIRTFALFFFFSGSLYVYTFKKRLKKPEVVTEADHLGAVDKNHGTISTIVLSMLNALFLIFIAAQMMFLFGGHDIIQKYDITYADYVHEGFFQMMWVAGLVLVISYIVHRFNKAKALTASKILNAVFIGQTLIIVVSALKRLFLYQEAYGLTQMRFLVWHFIIYTGIVLAVLAVVILMKKHYRLFIKIGFVVSVVYLMYMTGINMQAKIAQVNVDRFVSGQDEQLDYRYLHDFTVDVGTRFDHIPENESYTLFIPQKVARSSSGEWVQQVKDEMTLREWKAYWQAVEETQIRNKSWQEMSIAEWKFLAR
jgi:hypothetical protein